MQFRALLLLAFQASAVSLALLALCRPAQAQGPQIEATDSRVPLALEGVVLVG